MNFRKNVVKQRMCVPVCYTLLQVRVCRDFTSPSFFPHLFRQTSDKKNPRTKHTEKYPDRKEVQSAAITIKITVYFFNRHTSYFKISIEERKKVIERKKYQKTLFAASYQILMLKPFKALIKAKVNGIVKTYEDL